VPGAPLEATARHRCRPARQRAPGQETVAVRERSRTFSDYRCQSMASASSGTETPSKRGMMRGV
jgi:hypothetical protein